MLPGGTYREEYVREALSYGWRCPNRPDCGVWNSDEPKFLIICPHCGASRPRKLSVEKNTKGKR
jgi:hypothetical protein